MTNDQNRKESADGEDKEASKRDNKPLLADLFWRDEILQVMYWYQGEGFGTTVTARDLQTFLSAEEQSLTTHLERMVVEGYLEQAGEGDDAGPTGGSSARYSFSEYGAKEGARRFADEFADVTKQGHGDCPPDCPICKDLPPEDCVHCHSNAQEAQLYGA